MNRVRINPARPGSLRSFMQMTGALLALCLCAAGLRAETTGGGTLGVGQPWATDYFVRDSGVPGPVVVITGGVHGDEPAGALAADEIRNWPIQHGRMIVLPRANVIALRAGKRNTPGEPESLSNLNRDFPKAGESGPAQGALALAIWDFVQSQKPAWLLDLHEGVGVRGEGSKSVGSSIIVQPTDAGRAMADAMLSAVNGTITNASKHFVRLGPPVNGSLARGAGEHLGIHAMILETTSRDQPLSRRARQHRVMVHCFLQRLDMIADAVTPDWMTERPKPAGRTQVALFDAGGTFGNGIPRITQELGVVTNCTVVRVGPEDIQEGALDQFDVVIFSGGSGSAQARSIGERGRSKVKEFVERGGGYIGICAGAYLACDGFSWGAKVLDARTVSDRWKRGRGKVKIELTESGRSILGDRPGLLDVLYANGPILKPAHSDELPDYEPLAYFRTELAENGTPKGVMADSPAIVAAHCGKGRVICISPHPEQTDGLEDFIRRTVDWVAARN